MIEFICPKCKKNLIKSDNSLKCSDGHCFDISRKGTVNLLLSNKSSHGDDKLMVQARKAFLDKGYYMPLLDELKKIVDEYTENNDIIVDCGCGECWYTTGIYEYLVSKGKTIDMIGIDVSKEAINAGASRSRKLRLAVGTVFDMPIADCSTDMVISLFAPFSRTEYIRILKEQGIYITAFPLENHLYELKEVVYDNPYRNEVADMEVEGFTLLKSVDVHNEINICTNEDILALFSMTPYYYKTSEKDRNKLNSLSSLTTTIHFRVACYRKIQANTDKI